MINEKMVALGTARSAIRELFEYGKNLAAEIGAENVYDFSIGNPSVPPPDGVRESIRKLTDTVSPVELHGYTSAQGDAAVRAKIAGSINRRYGADYGADNLYLTVGAAAALCCCFKGLTCPGDEYVLIAPYFPEYKVFIESFGGTPVIVPARTEDFQIHFDALDQAITARTKGVVINSPNNPSGAVYSAQTLAELAGMLYGKSVAFGHPIYLISDEPYREIAFGCDVPWVPDFYRNTLVCYSYSKALSVPGERIGFVLVPPAAQTDGAQVYAAVAGAGRALGYVNAPSLFQRVIADCCEESADLTVYRRNRDLLVGALREYGYACVEPQGTFYVFPQTLEPDAVAFCERAKQFRLLLVPGDVFGCPGHCRIAICTPTERVERSLEAFRRLAESYR